MRPLLAAFALTWAGLSASGARPAIPPEALAEVGVHTRAGAQAPLDLGFVDQDGRATTLGAALDGRPGVVLFEDYRCTTLCGPALAITGHMLAASGLDLGRDVGFVAVGLNPRETPADARAIRDARLADAPALRRTGRFLTGTAPAIAAAARALGYGYAYDPASGQYTHPVAAFVLTREGRLSRVLDQVNLTGPELRAAVDAAGQGGFGSVVDQLALICHGISVAAGRYNGAVALGLKVGALATLLAMAGGLGWLATRRRPGPGAAA
jgi:protein SCO1